MPGSTRQISVEFTGDAGDLDRASKDAADSVDRVKRSSDDLGDSFGDGASKSAQFAGAMGDLGGALSQAGGPLGTLGSGMEVLGPSIMGVTGVMDLAELATGAWSKANVLLGLAMDALPFVAIGIAIALLIAGIILAYQHSETFRDIVQGAFDVVKQAAQIAWQVIGVIFDLWVAQFRIAWAIAQIFGNIVGNVFDAARAAVQSAVSWITDRIGDLVGVFTRLPGQLASAAGDMWGFITGGFRSALNAVIGWWNNFELSIGPISIPFAPDIPKITIGTPNIPYLAGGAIVRRATLAVVGERGPEAVIPLGKSGLRAGGPTYVQVDVHVPPTANPAETGRAVASSLRAYFSAGGRLRVPA